MLSYIYKYTNKENGMVYIGQTVDLKGRYYTHLCGNQYIDKEIQRLGIEAFTYEVIDQADISEINDLETYWISFYDSFHNGYNRTAGGSGFNIPKRVYCVELDMTFESIHEAANAMICSLGLDVVAYTARKNIKITLNSWEGTIYGFHFCNEELKDIFLADLEEFSFVG